MLRSLIRAAALLAVLLLSASCGDDEQPLKIQLFETPKIQLVVNQSVLIKLALSREVGQVTLVDVNNPRPEAIEVQVGGETVVGPPPASGSGVIDFKKGESTKDINVIGRAATAGPIGVEFSIRDLPQETRTLSVTVQ
jgi:hypothetical protein